MNLVKSILPVGTILTLVTVCVILVVFLVKTSSEWPLTSLESILFQIVILGTGVTASYLISQRSARAAAEQLVKPHGRSAFRRAKSLYSGLFYLKRVIQHHKDSGSEDANEAVKVIEAVVDQHVNTVADAIEDWRDLVPEEVADLERKVEKHEAVVFEDLRR